jgi:hypothetical protein
VPSNYQSLTLDWYDNSDNYTTTADFTADVKAIPHFTDTGTGEVNQATIVLRSLEGKFIENGNIVEKHDRFNIQMTDLAGNTYDRYFEVVDIIPSSSKAEGTLLTLECLGIEYHTQHIHFAKPYYFTNGSNVAKDIGDIYEENNGSNQPTLASHNVVWNGTVGNALPGFDINNFEYGLNEETCYNRWMDLIDKYLASVSAGGALKIYELSFIADAKNLIRFRLRESGDNTPTVTIKNAKVTNPKTVGAQEGDISNPTGTNVLAWGSADHGSLPVEFSKYDSELIQFIFRPEWDSTVTYPTDARVKVTASNGTAQHYKSLVDNNLNNTPPGPTAGSNDTDSNWQQIDMKEEFGDSINYSLWTDDKALLWSNAMGNPTAAERAWDINLVVWDDQFFRTWVDAVATTNAQLDALASTSSEGYSYDGTRTGFPRGFRVLVDADSPTGDLANFANMVAEWTGTAWAKKYSFDSNNDNVQIAVIDEAKIYEYDHATTNFSDISSSAYANDCFHPVTSITNVDGVDLVNGTPRSEITDATNYPEITDTTGQSFSKNVDSAIRFRYTWGDIVSAAASASSPTGSWYTRGAWACWRVPFPNNDYNGITEGVGDIYGGGTNNQTEPATLDIQNMHLTHDGLRGFNQGSSSEDLGQINSIAFWMKIDLTLAGATLNDEHRLRCFMIDTSDNIIFADFAIEFSGTWQDVRIPISAFRVYRGRKPVYGFDAVIANFVPPKELEIINIFEWRNIKFVGIQYQPVYDKFGRYNPTNAVVNENGNSVTFSQFAGGTLDMTIDGFRFVKPLLVTSGQASTINLEPTFMQRPNISVYKQLLNDAKSQLEIEKFQNKTFDIETSGDDVFDIDFADSFYLENDQLVNDSDNGANTIKLVAKRIEYSLTKPPNGPGGLKRRILGAKIFT